MVAFRADRLSDTEDRLAMPGAAKCRGGIAEAGRGGGRLLEQIEDAGAIRCVIAVHQAEQPAFRRAQTMQHRAPLAELDEAACQIAGPSFGNAELRHEIGIVTAELQRSRSKRYGKTGFGDLEQDVPQLEARVPLRALQSNSKQAVSGVSLHIRTATGGRSRLFANSLNPGCAPDFDPIIQVDSSNNFVCFI